MSNKTIITRDNAAVVINVQTEDDGTLNVWANMYVNTRKGLENADITLTRFEGKTLAGAIKWANKQLDRHCGPEVIAPSFDKVAGNGAAQYTFAPAANTQLALL